MRRALLVKVERGLLLISSVMLAQHAPHATRDTRYTYPKGDDEHVHGGGGDVENIRDEGGRHAW